MVGDLLTIDSKRRKIKGDLTKDDEESVKVVRKQSDFQRILKSDKCKM